jgi:hypothetical protein
MSQKDETRGTADSIRAANYLKRWAILYRWEKRIKLKEGEVVWIILLAPGARTIRMSSLDGRSGTNMGASQMRGAS